MPQNELVPWAAPCGAQLDGAGRSPAPGVRLSPMCLLLLQVKQALGLKGLFLRGPKPGSLDSHAAGRPLPRPSVSQRLLRRTASAPTKSQKPGRKAFPELVLGLQDTGSEGEAGDAAPSSPGPTPEAPTREEPGSRSPRGKAPVERSPEQEQPPRAPVGPGPAGMAATCMKWPKTVGFPPPLPAASPKHLAQRECSSWRPLVSAACGPYLCCGPFAGYVFVDFSSEEEVRKALKCNREYMGKDARTVAGALSVSYSVRSCRGSAVCC